MKKNKKILGFVALIIGCFLSVLDSTIVNIALPNIANYFNESINDISWITTAYLISFSIFLIIASKMADQFGRKKVFIIGIIIFGVASGLCGVSRSILFLIMMRFIQGIGAAILTPVIIPLGLELFGKEKRGFIIAVSGGITALAAAIGPPMGGILLQNLNWNTIFYINVPLCIIAMFLGILFLDESFDSTVSKEIDVFGMILLTVSLFCITFGLLKGSDYGWNSYAIIILLTTFVISMILFLIVESKVFQPMLPLNLFKEITFSASCICYMVVGFGIASPLLILNFYLEKVLMYSPLKSGLILMTLSLSGVVSIPLGSLLSKRIGTRIINFSGIILIAVATIGLAHIDNNTSILIMRIILIIFGFGFGFSVQSISSAIKYLPLEKSGMASGIINAGRQIGTCIGVAILVSILNTNINNAVTNIKYDVKYKINMDKTLNTNIKYDMLIKLNNIKDESSSFSKDDLQNNINAEAKKVLDKIPVNKRVFVLRNLEAKE